MADLGGFQFGAFQLNFQQEEVAQTGMQVVLLPGGRRFTKRDLALYALACYARSYAGSSYMPFHTYNPAAFKQRGYASLESTL